MKVITAIGTPYINEKLSEIEGVEIMCKDIIYQEGIIEILQENREIDMLVVSNILPTETSFEELIKSVKKNHKQIDIIVFLEKRNSEIEAFLNSYNIYKIYELSEKDIDVFIKTLTIGKNKMLTEINDFKDLLINEKENIKYRNKEGKNFNFFKRKKTSKIHQNFELKSNKIIVITGYFGTGKSIISVLLSLFISKQNKKVLLIDFDLTNRSIKTMLGIKNYKNNFNEKDIIVEKISDKLDILGFCVLNDNIESIDKEKIRQILDIQKGIYDFIIIDTSSNIKFEYVKMVLKCGDKVLMLVEPNVSEIRKSRELLDIFINDFYLDASKIKFLFNKTNKYQIANSILEEIFSNYEIVGNIEYDESYNLFINKNFNVFNIEKYKKIYEKLQEEKWEK